MKTFQIVVSQNEFSFASSEIVGEQITFELAAAKVLTTFARYMLIAKMDNKAATRKSKDGETKALRPSVAKPFEVTILTINKNKEANVLTKDTMKFQLTEKNLTQLRDTLPKRLWLLLNEEVLTKDITLAFKSPEHFKSLPLS